MTDAPNAAHERAARVALAAFGIDDADLIHVSTSENATFRATTAVGSFVLRLHRPGYHSLVELESERVWLDALRAAGIAVPTPIPSPDGEYFVAVDIDDRDELRYVGLAHWVEGEIVAELGETSPDAAPVGQTFAQLGELMARLHEQACAWEPPHGFVRHRLDASGLVGDAPFWGRFWENPMLDGAQRRRLRDARDHCRMVLADYGEPADRFSMIHADLHLANLLSSDGRLHIIDFDDAGFGWHQYDIAVALFHSRHTPDFGRARDSFLAAYRSVRPLSSDDLALVDLFELVRSMALIGWKADRPEIEWPVDFFDYLVDFASTGAKRLTEPGAPADNGNTPH